MAIPATLLDYLKACDIDYEEVKHDYEVSSSRIAQQAHVTGDQLAKAIMLHSRSGYRLAVLPSTCDADIDSLSRLFDEPVELASEEDIMHHFRDCDPGAITPVGQAYGLQVYVDDMLRHQSDIYFDAGDHQTLLHMSGKEFERLMGDSPHGQFSRHH